MHGKMPMRHRRRVVATQRGSSDRQTIIVSRKPDNIKQEISRMSGRKNSKLTVRTSTAPAKKRFSPGKKIMFGTFVIALIAVLVWLPAVNMADTPVVTV